jgi:hypothetical protein
VGIPNVADHDFFVNAIDYRDLVITDLADENDVLRAYIREIEADMGTYRELAVANFDALHRLSAEHSKLVNDYTRLADDSRRLREDTLIRRGAAA